MEKFSRKLFTATLLFLIAACSQAAAVAPGSDGSSPSNQPSVADTVAPPAAVPTDTPSPTATVPPTPPPSLADPAGYAWVPVASGFSKPLLVTNAGDGSGRLFVVEQDGRIWIVQDGATLPEPFLDIVEQVGSESNEQGLLGLAFHPDYEQNGSFYIDYTDNNGDTVVSRYRVSVDANIADAASEQVLLQVDQPYPNHNGGHLAFGPDGYLYIGLGDGGSQGDPHGNGQSLETLLAKILRIDVNSGSPYGIPADNPFANGGGLPEIWAYGLRNPWRFNFDTATGDLYIADVGGSAWEEVNWLPGGIVGGSNFGWNYMEGMHNHEGDPPEGLLSPVVEYSHSEGGCSVTGGYVYRGAALPAWNGVYFYADYCSGLVWGLVQHADGAWESRLLFDTRELITSFGQDEAGELYLVARSGTIYQLQAQ